MLAKGNQKYEKKKKKYPTCHHTYILVHILSTFPLPCPAGETVGHPAGHCCRRPPAGARGEGRGRGGPGANPCIPHLTYGAPL